MHDITLLDERCERRDGIGDGDLGGAVEDDTHRAVVPVLPDEHDRAVEVRVEKPWPGDEQLTAK